MIEVGDLELLLRRGRAGGLSGITSPVPGVYLDTDTGRPVVPYGSGTFLDSSTGAVLDASGRVVSAPSTGGGISLADVKGLVGETAALAAPFAQMFAPKPKVVVAAPWTTGEVLAVSAAVAVPVGLGLWALWTKKSRRR